MPSGFDSFATGIKEGATAPIDGAAQLFGADLALPRSKSAGGAEESASDKALHTAGQFVGGTGVFAVATLGARLLLPGAGRYAPVIAGATLGFLAPSENNSLLGRAEHALIGGGAAFALDGAAGVYKRFHSTTPAQQLVAEAGSQYRQQFVEIPMTHATIPARAGFKSEIAAGSEVAQGYNLMQSAVGRAEVLANARREGLVGRHGTVFGVTNDGKLMTANHVTEGALDITVFDRFERAHSARVIGFNAERDLSLLQLTDPASFGVFKPLKLANTAELAPQPFMSATAYGHPNGWRDLHAAPGRVGEHQYQRGVTTRYDMSPQQGYSGSPIIREGSTEVTDIYRQGLGNSDVQATPAHHAQQLLDKTTATESGATALTNAGPKAKFDFQLIKSFRIHDQAAASENLGKLFGNALSGQRPPEFFHSKVRTVPVPGTASGDVTMQMQFRPADRQVVIKPIAFDGKPIPADAVWPNTQLKASQSRLVVSLDENGLPKHMTSYNDPGNILQEGFNYRGENNYLATLRQTPVPAWQQLLPSALRFKIGNG